ncbi:hypothetical protein EF888_01125 [Silicimonas algicola]|uniref:Uncharacterized protein n=1 Tax=Silicimonas algicola TaxID=1826607 RepID=A0A316G1G2_9RHOB|nr:hypothetical protein [Silicimonas algicola]AZQ65857.1 hypothetical protein EF888_01125 [Silicimonas algicola]PWK54761.1 hypothetical protein C8D95_11053 [Silicimonas algicola]
MRILWRWTKRLVFGLFALVLLLLLPVGYVEVACTGEAQTGESYVPLVAPEWRRPESRTLTTYPEWHIVHAYDDYARVIATGDPHDFSYLRAIAGFWTSLCPLKAQADGMGGMTGDQKMTIYTIGVSFTAELLAKAAYEETLGRLATLVRGPERAPLDDVSADQAARYAAFLQQVSWYKWDFRADVDELRSKGGDSLRDRERRVALGLEYRAKAAYARQIEAAVAGMGEDALRMRSVVSGLTPENLEGIDGVTVVSKSAGGIEIETDRYRAFTRIAERIAQAGGDFIEIAGNDDILFTALSSEPAFDDALFSFPLQASADHRHLVLTPVADLANRLRQPGSLKIEHVHDY